MTDYPKYVVMHGVPNVVLKRCSDPDTCYSKYATVDSLFEARDLAEKLNKADQALRKALAT